VLGRDIRDRVVLASMLSAGGLAEGLEIDVSWYLMCLPSRDRTIVLQHESRFGEPFVCCRNRSAMA